MISQHSYAGHEVVGTRGIPLLGVYKGLKLNFIRPKFVRKLRRLERDVGAGAIAGLLTAVSVCSRLQA